MAGASNIVPRLGDKPATIEAQKLIRNEKTFEVEKLDFDGAWVVHPLLIETTRRCFQIAIKFPKLHQKGKPLTLVDPNDLLQFINFRDVLEPNKQNPLSKFVYLQDVEHMLKIVFAYFVGWLTKEIGAAGAISLDSLMEDAATVEICRA